MIAAVIYNTSGVKKALGVNDFMPDYLQERKQLTTEKSLEVQHLEFIAFKEKLNAVH